MSSDARGAPAIRVERLGKRFFLRDRSGEDVWALRDVSFEVAQGDVLGIVGRNGAGKSTLLKILCRITEPTEGRAEIRGRLRALLEVGTGFHPDLTGRENIYLNGAFLGMRSREIDAKFDEIVAFAEVSRFLDTPVKRYSSGMYTRLAFAVAAHLEPEILIVDEVLAVGDLAFQRKCLSKLESIARSGRTILFVSHNLGVLETLCPRAVLLENGRVTKTGETRDVLAAYTSALAAEVDGESQCDAAATDARAIDVGLVESLDSRGLPARSVRFGEPFGFRMHLSVARPLSSLDCAVDVLDERDEPVFGASLASDSHRELTALGRHVLTCRFATNVLVPGQYRARVSARVAGGTAEAVARTVPFQVLPTRSELAPTLETRAGCRIASDSAWTIALVEGQGGAA